LQKFFSYDKKIIAPKKMQSKKFYEGNNMKTEQNIEFLRKHIEREVKQCTDMSVLYLICKLLLSVR